MARSGDRPLAAKWDWVETVYTRVYGRWPIGKCDKVAGSCRGKFVKIFDEEEEEEEEND